MKSFYGFLSQNEIFLEELDLGLKEKKKYFISTSIRRKQIWK